MFFFASRVDPDVWHFGPLLTLFEGPFGAVTANEAVI